MAIDLKNKTILITGARDGIGKNTAVKLAKMGANLIVAAINEDKGSETSTYLRSSLAVEGLSGKYFDKCKVKTSSPQSRDIDTRKKLWNTTEEILKNHL